MNPRPVLLVEDCEDDFVLMRAAWKSAHIKRLLARVKDGIEAIDYLVGKGMYADRQRYCLPSLVLTDLKMPRMNGFDFLQWLQNHSEFESIPVVVLSASDLEEDCRRAEELGASGYFFKPCAFKELTELMGRLDKKWLAAKAV